MSTYTQILYQIVYSTKYRRPTLVKENRSELFKYIWGILKNKKCHLYRINGVEDHLHIVTHIHPSVGRSCGFGKGYKTRQFRIYQRERIVS